MNLKITYLLSFLLAMFCFSTGVNAQDTLDVPAFDQTGKPNLAQTILTDTAAGGVRKNPNRVYRLKSGDIYIVDQTLFVKFPLRIVSDNAPGVRPPILVKGTYANGVNLSHMFKFTKDGLQHRFEGLIFQGVDLKRKYAGEWNKCIEINGDDISLKFSKCVFNAWAGRFIGNTGSNNSMFFRDCNWRNGVYLKHQFGGQQVISENVKYIDSLVVTNCTFFNCGGFWLFQENGVANYVLVEHNTLFTSQIDLFRMRDLVNARFRSNLFYGTHAYGQNEEERKMNWFDTDNEYISFFSLDKVDKKLLQNIGIEESDRQVKCTNNSYYSPKAMTDFWSKWKVHAPVWMNKRTSGMFGDDTAYPGLIAEDNVEADPAFEDKDMEAWVTAEVVKFCDDFRKGKSIASSSRNYDKHVGAADILKLPWPLPENLVYTNPQLLKGGHDGLPVGDLNWYPEKRKLYKEDINATKSPSSIQNQLAVGVFPNPTADDIWVSFGLAKAQDVTISIITPEGLSIQTRPLHHLSQGKYNVRLPLNGMDDGLYLVRVRTDDASATSKVIIQH